MVFRKKSRTDFQTRFKKGSLPPNKGKTLVKENKKDTQKPSVRLTKEWHQLITENATAVPPVRFLRPMQTERPEIEKCADCEPDHRYAIFITVFSLI